MKKPAIAFTICDDKNKWMLPYLENSLRKFHTPEELPLLVYGQKELDMIQDPAKFYKATPLFARKLIKEYDLVLKLDVDQIIMGSLDFILKMKDYDIGTVLNINRVDPPRYGLVQVFDIPPHIYYNCGMVAMRNEEFVNHWFDLCNSYHFNQLQYKEQDLLNIMCHYGDYKVRCFDMPDKIYNYFAWHGLVFKGEENKAILRNGKVIVPRGQDNYPDHDMEVKAWHSAGGGMEKKLNYRVFFNEELIKHIDYLISDEKTKK